MTRFKRICLFTGILLQSTVVLMAQKPNPSAGLEIKLAPENAQFHISSNMNILERTGFPSALYQLSVPVQGTDPETQCRNYLQSNRSLLGISNSDIQQLRLHKIRRDDGGTVVRLRQTYLGLP
ncbi:MAG: hypothetical protein ACOYKE_10190, partial [Ferruginibacter sp.]